MIIYRNNTALINELSGFIAKASNEKLNQKLPFSFFLAGGNSPKQLYNNLPDYIKSWDHVHLFLGDERYLPETSSESNRKMIHEFLLNRITIPQNNIHFPITTVEPFLAAEKYDLELKTYLSANKSFDLILIGIGSDSHMLSLFPFTKALDSDALYSDNLISHSNAWRLTATFNLLSRVKQICVLVTDSNKQKAIDSIFSYPDDIKKYPAQFLKNLKNVTWFISNEINLKS